MTEIAERTCVVTGASSGIGLALSHALARRGTRVAMVCRDGPLGERVRGDVIDASGNPFVDLWIADLSFQRSVHELAQRLRRRYPRIDVLVNNAGAIYSVRRLSRDGIEMHFATNYLAPFLLSNLLRDALESSDDGRILNVTSALYAFGRIRLDDLGFERRWYYAPRAYAQSKRALTLFTFELSRRLRGTGVSANCVDPGLVRTRIGEKSVAGMQRLAWRLLKPFGRSADRAAQPIVRLALSDDVKGISGRCFRSGRPDEIPGATKHAEMAHRLWDASRILVRNISVTSVLDSDSIAVDDTLR
jgi:NAD(P)-dependent dehydrogenase (short-subunit alcohol dehydrogenase family)